MAASLEICQVCLKHMDDPRILPCHHSFCLKCLESSTVLTKSCPTCKMEFKIPEGGLKNLKKNNFIDQLNILKQNNINCDSCNANKAVKFCVECSFNYCSTCLGPHGRIPTTSNHQLETARTSKHGNKVNKYSTCDEHSDVMNLFCEDCNVAICGHCLALNHNAHKLEPISKYFETTKYKLENDIKFKEQIIKDIVTNYNSSEIMMHDNMIKASNLKQEVQEKGESLKKAIDLIVDELIKNVDEELKQHEKEADDVMEELKNLEANMKAQLETLKQQSSSLNYQNMAEISAKVMDKKPASIIHKYSKIFNISLINEVDEISYSLNKLVGSLGKGQKINLIKALALDGTYKSFTSSDKNIFLCDGSKIKVFDCKEWNLNPSFEFKPNLKRVSDLLVMDGMLFVAGSDEHDIIKVIGLDDFQKLDKALVIYKLKNMGYVFKLNKSSCGNILLILLNKILFLSVKGDVMKTINLTFEIYNALQFDERCFVVVCDDAICFINDSGEKDAIHHPHWWQSDKWNLLKYVNCLAKDDCGHIYFGFAGSDIVILDSDLNFLTFHNIGVESVRKIIYDEVKLILLVLAGKFESSKLLMFR